MPRLSYTPRSMDDLERFQKFLFDADYENALQAIGKITSSIDKLKDMPFLGRAVHDSEMYRELIIPFGGSGYIALYRYFVDRDLVRIVAIKHQKEDDYYK